MNTCDYYQDLISRLVDGEVSREEYEDLMEHMKSCSRCNAMYAVFHEMSEILQSEEPEPLPEGLHENIMAGVRRSAIEKKNRRLRATWVRTALTAAACAVLVLFAAKGLGPADRTEELVIRNSEELQQSAAAAASASPAAEETAAPAAPEETTKPAASPAVQTPAPATASPAPTAAATAPAQTADPYAADAVERTPAPAPKATATPAPRATEPPAPRATETPAPKAAETPVPAETAASAATEAPALATESAPETAPPEAKAAGTESAAGLTATPNVQAEEPKQEADVPAENEADSGKTAENPEEAEAAPAPKSFLKGFKSMLRAPTPALAIPQEDTAEPANEGESANQAEETPAPTATPTPSPTASAKPRNSSLRLTGNEKKEKLTALLGGEEKPLPEGEADSVLTVTLMPEDPYGGEEELSIRFYGDAVYYVTFPQEKETRSFLADCSAAELRALVKELRSDAEAAESPVPAPTATADPFLPESPAVS